ncbi:hypothetical protein [Hymenobacter cellulosilyticus]|uniref:Uncharacterized protein n=1 Tax=Hymenobacter cellulosilyticus TaxID=2932248 RepID=A0A8T9Q7M0_9BACT|nr:hypothetical protein [Hymenobacter cellulosilyticus]UOQ73577.1 hypothetical protein MUN79_06510 [Hymenobacter cellulosilyticus]
MESQIEEQLEKIMPEDLARTFESAYHVLVQGDHDHIDDLLRHGGTLLKKAAQRFTPTQLILGIAAIAAVAVVAVNRSMDTPDTASDDEGTSAEPVKEPKARAAGSAANKDNQGNKGAQEHQGH